VALALYGQQAILVQNFNRFAAGVRMSFRRPIWPEVREMRAADGESAIRVDSNLAQMQVAPRHRRLLRIVADEGS
jgi:hypothetical protein